MIHSTSSNLSVLNRSRENLEEMFDLSIYSVLHKSSERTAISLNAKRFTFLPLPLQFEIYGKEELRGQAELELKCPHCFQQENAWCGSVEKHYSISNNDV